MSRILVTGMSGLVGQSVREKLAVDHELSALNRSDVDGIPTIHASLDDYEGIRPAFDGVDTVVHLAAKITDAVGFDELLAVNVVGTRHVFEAAADAGVKRIIFTSSGATVSGWERSEPYRSIVAGDYENVSEIPLIDETMATRPANLYASTKVWGESIARRYAYEHGITVISLRIGWTSRVDRAENARQVSVFNSRRDVVQAIECSLTADIAENYDVFFILSNNRWGYRSIERARKVLGFEPQDSGDD